MNPLAGVQICLHALREHGKLIIVDRDATSSTLPLPSDVNGDWSEASKTLPRLLEQLQRDRRTEIDIVEDMLTIRFLTTKLYWFSLLYHRAFYPLTLMNGKQVDRSAEMCFSRSHPAILY